jgi:SAM-dependent methyltransferase
MAVDVLTRAVQSLGLSSDPIYRAVAKALTGRHLGGGTLLDVGCGTGRLWSFVGDQFERYVGVDVVRHDGFPPAGEFYEHDIDKDRVPLPDGTGDVVAAVETIEHLENPRAFARELCRLCKSGGWVVITTPNQLSLLSKLTLVLKNQFNAFTETSYPAHLTALLEVDLRRIAAECGLVQVAIQYTTCGRIPGTSRHYPSALSRAFPQAFSDNVVLIGRRATLTD